jgi:hypothetical protein
MKRFILFLLIVLLAVGAQAQTLARRDSLRVASRLLAGRGSSSDSQVTEVIANQFLNMAIAKASDEFPMVIKYDTIACTPRIEMYALDSMFDTLIWCNRLSCSDSTLRPLRIVPHNEHWVAMKQAKAEPLESVDPNVLPNYVSASGEQLFVYPEPRSYDTLFLCYSAIGRKLTHDTMTTDIKRGRFREMVVTLTAHYICLDVEKFEKAALLKAAYETEYLRSLRRVPPEKL